MMGFAAGRGETSNVLPPSQGRESREGMTGTGPGAEAGRKACSLPLVVLANGVKIIFRDFSARHSLPACNGGGLRCLPLCAFSVASPIPTPHPINQKAMARRISGESAIRSGHGGGADRERDNMRASYQHHGDGERRESDRRTEGQRTPPRTDHRLAQRTPTPRVSAPPFACGQHGAGENTPSQKFSMF